MSLKKRSVVSAGSTVRIAILIICAIFLSSLRTAQPLINAQVANPVTEEITQTQSFGSGSSDATPEGLNFTFSNTAAMAIPVGGQAMPYPSVINVTNIPRELAKVTVTLHNMNHLFPTDMDILLVGPQGQTAVIMSDVAGADDLENVTVTLDDEAATQIHPLAALVSGTYIPTNGTSGGFDNFPAPAPPASINSSLSVFNGTNPNGEWRLFVYDDVPIDSGSISGGWSLTFTSAFSGENTGPIGIPATGTASPYPSDIVLADHNNPVSKVRVKLVNFSHSSPDDVDILLVSPSGRSVLLMSDAGGGNGLSNVTLTFDDAAGTHLPDQDRIVSGIYRPTDFEPGDTFPAPAPAGAPSGRLLSSLNGTAANGAWKLFVVDDSGNNVGDISGGWNVLVENTAGTITVAGGSVANPYPAEITVSGLLGNITSATVSIRNFSHTLPDDADILLVGPNNRKIVLMSDAGGGTEVGGLNITFDDAGQSQIPDSGPLSSGTYRPTDHEPGDVFPTPAPSGPPTGTTLGSFYGGAPNGIWRLFVVNDGAGFGSIAGDWSITLQTSTGACVVNLSPSVQAFPIGGGSGSFNVEQRDGCSWSASSTDSFVGITSGSSGGGNGVVSFTVAANSGPARTGTVDVSNGVFTRSFLIQQESGCVFTVGQSTVNLTAAGGTRNVSVSAGGACGWQGSTTASWIQITSQPQTGSGTLAFTVQPNTSRSSRSGTINVGTHVINVNQAGVRTVPFDFNGDGRTDISVFRPSTGTWWITPATAQAFGISTDKIVPADYDGDLKTDIAVYRDGTWYVLKSTDGTVEISSWGTNTDLPVPADYNADGKAELAVFRPSTGVWWILNSNGTFSSTAFGLSSDIPTPGDFDGDGRADLSVYRGTTSSSWWILNSSDSSVVQHAFGVQGDIPVAADYDGDGRDNIALFRPSTGVWYRSNNASTNYDSVQWGISTDRPALGDYDGDGRADPAVFRSGVWYILGSTSGTQIVQFGVSGDHAVPSAYVP